MGVFRTILIADDEPSIRHVLTLALTDAGYDVRAVADGEEALNELEARAYDVVVSDVRMPKVSGMELLEKALEKFPGLTFVVMSAYGSQDEALSAVARGAWDYVQKPFKPQELLFVLRKAEERHRLIRENTRLRAAGGSSAPLDRILGVSDAVKSVRRQIEKLAPVNTTILVTGESGTGKELVAKALHELSPRSGMPFVAVNCGAIPAGLIESELFGHARGAFTDARTARRGLFTEADGGTLFLDEVGELPQPAQIKLLRVLQEGEVRPVGENRADKVNVRVVAATLRDLQKLVEKGEFREDLYYRLNVVQIRIPPLRDRAEDVTVLANAFLARFNREMNRNPPVAGFTASADAVMTAYAWPGNVRELENAVERGVLLTDGDEIDTPHLPEKLWTVQTPTKSQRPDPEDLSLKRAVRNLEESYMKAALRRTRGNRTRAAELLEISHRALLYKIKEFGIDPDAEGEG